MFVTAEGSSVAIFWRAIERGNIIVAEGIAREFEVLPLEFALALVHLYGRAGDKRYERAALRYLERYLTEQPSLADVAGVAVLLAERRLG